MVYLCQVTFPRLPLATTNRKKSQLPIRIIFKYKIAAVLMFVTQDIYFIFKSHMSKGGYKIFDQGGMYFVSFAVVSWVDPPNGGQVVFYTKRI